MTTKKDLAEAHAYSRRRLVAAFVSGAPGGREVEPARPLRAIVAGLAGCVLLVAAAAIVGVFAGRTPDSWLNPGTLVFSKERGVPYLVQPDGAGDGVWLRPFVNATSTQLLLGDQSPVRVDQAQIEQQVIGPDIGILGAPTQVPSQDRLVQSGWSACPTDTDGISVRLSPDPPQPLGPGSAMVVSSNSSTHLIATAGDGTGATVFTLPRSRNLADQILSNLQVDEIDQAQPVNASWLVLFPSAPQPLATSAFNLGAAAGTPVSYADQVGGGNAQIGDVVTEDARDYLLTAAGPAELTPFARAVYLAVTGESPREIPAITISRVSPDSVWPTVWPEDDLTLVGRACAEMTTTPGARPVAGLAAGELPVTSPAAGEIGIEVAPGYGALVSAGGTQDFLIDSTGRLFPLTGDDTVEHLGLAGAGRPEVFDRWLDLFPEGPTLSTLAAGEQPDS